MNVLRQQLAALPPAEATEMLIHALEVNQLERGVAALRSRDCAVCDESRRACIRPDARRAPPPGSAAQAPFLDTAEALAQACRIRASRAHRHRYRGGQPALLFRKALPHPGQRPGPRLP